MSTAKVQRKQDTLLSTTRRQTTWIRSDDKHKTWKKAASKPASKTISRRNTSISEQKSDVTRSGRLSDGTGTSNVTNSSSEPSLNFKRLQDVDDVEQRESIEKCLKWMETLPNKFSGMHILVAPSGYDDVS